MKAFGRMSDIDYDKNTRINISVTLPHYVFLIIGFYKLCELLYESLISVYRYHEISVQNHQKL
jgi:hypothetical protein